MHFPLTHRTAACFEDKLPIDDRRPPPGFYKEWVGEDFFVFHKQ